MILKVGLAVPSKYIPNEHYLMRYVPYSKIARDENDEPVGLLPDAFKMRPGESYLSATWVDYFDGSHQEAVADAVRCIRQSSLTVGAKAGFALGLVREISECCRARSRAIRIIHEPEDDNAAHVALRQWPVDDDELFHEMSVASWSRLIRNCDVDP